MRLISMCFQKMRIAGCYFAPTFSIGPCYNGKLY